MSDKNLKRELRMEKFKYYMRQAKGQIGRILALVLVVGLVAGVIALLQTTSSSEAATSTADALKRNGYGTYLLKVDTGAGAGDTVYFFAIRYKDNKGVSHTQYLYPHEGSLTEGFDTSSLTNGSEMEARKNLLKDKFQVVPTGGGLSEGLKSNTTDFYTFSPRFVFAEVEGIDVFMAYPKAFRDILTQTISETEREAQLKKKAETAKISLTWTCRDISLYRLEDIYSIDNLGYVSGSAYMSFKGELLASLMEDAVDLNINLSDRLTRGGVTRDGTAGGKIADPIASPYLTFYIPEDPISFDCRESQYTFKFDIADVYGAGIESDAALYSGEGKGSVDKPVEALGLVITYTDIGNKIRTVKVPVVLSAAANAVRKGAVDENLSVLGLAQQGESLIVPVNLPNLVAFNTIQMEVGSKALSEAGFEYVEGAADNTTIKTRSEMLKDDNIRLAGMQIYKGDVEISRVSGSDEFKLTVAEDAVPWYFFTASDVSGVQINTGRTELLSRLSEYKAGVALTPQGSEGKYLVVVKTDDMDMAGTTSPVSISLHYDAVDGTAKSTPTYNLADLAMDYYGYWPGKLESNANGTNVGYAAAMRPGGEMVFTMSVSDVNKFTGASISIPSSSTDDWQLKELVIYDRAGYGERVGKWQDISDVNFKTNRVYTRSHSEDGLVVARFPLDGSSLLLTGQSNSKDVSFDESATVSATDQVEQLDFAKMYYNMSFADTQKDLQFTKAAYGYKVNVKVANNEDAAYSAGSDGDTGSRNKFYFQLVFENGTSGYVLANQQISADRFRAGCTETFTIYTNRDFGNVTAVSIIPEDNTAEDNDYYMDKLNIEFIEIAKITTSNVVQTWRVDSLGWVDINYVDRGTENTMSKRSARYEDEIAKTYRISSMGYKAQFMVALTTGSYATNAKDASNKTIENKQLVGAVNGTLNYYAGDELKTESFDLVKAIYEYCEMSTMYYSSGAAIGKGRSFSNVMFRPEHTDRFYIALPNVTSVDSLIIGVSSEVATAWNLRSVNIYQVENQGNLQISVGQEYVNSQKVTLLAEGLSENMGTLGVFAPETPSMLVGAEQEKIIRFTPNEVKTMEIGTDWTSVVTAAPTSKNDTLNLYVHLKDTASPNYQMDAKIWWHSGLTQTTRKESLYNLSRGDSGNVFYVTSIPASGVDTIQALHLKANSTQVVTDKLDYAVVQHVRDGVTIGNTYFSLNGMSMIGMVDAVTPSGNLSEFQSDMQYVYLQLGENGQAFNVNRGQDDILVALKYKTGTGDGGGEFATIYTYLSDVLDANTQEKVYTEVKPGMVLEIPFSEPFISEVTGIEVVGVGSAVGLNVDRAALNIVSSTDANARDRWISFAGGALLSRDPRTLVASADEVSLVTMNFETYSNAEILNDGRVPKLQMSVNFMNYRTNQMESFTLGDANNYLSSGEFKVGSTAEVRFLLTNANSIRSVTVSPISGAENLNAQWGVSSASATMLGHVNDLGKANTIVKPELKTYNNSSVNRLIEQGNPTTVNLSTITVVLKAAAYNNITKVNDTAQTAANGSTNISVKSGTVVEIYPKVSGSLDGMGYTATIKQNTTSDDDGYSVDCMKDDGAGKIVVTPPANTTSNTISYTVTVSSEEVPDVKASVIINVEGTGEDEAKALQAQIDAANSAKQAAEDAKKAAEDAKEAASSSVSGG